MGVVRSIVVTVVAVALAVGALTAGTVVVLARAMPARVPAAVAPPAPIDLGLPPGTPPTGAAVPSSPSPSARYAAIAGSPSYLVYAWTARDDGVPVVGEAEPFGRNHRVLLDRNGRTTAIPGRYAVSLLGDRPLLLRLARTPRFPGGLPANATARPIALRWRLPAEGTTGTPPLAAHTAVVAFAPGGAWVTATTVGSGDEDTQFAPIDRLAVVRTSGRRTSLGIPFPRGAPYTLHPGESGLLAYSDSGDGGDLPPNGRIRFHAWSGGGWRTLNPTDPPQDEIDCSTVSARLARCATLDADRTVRSRVYHLPGGTATVLPRASVRSCGVPDLATTTGFLGLRRDATSRPRCVAGTVTFVDERGRTTSSTRVYDRFHQPVIAFGRIVVDEVREHRLLALTTLDGAPQVLVGR